MVVRRRAPERAHSSMRERGAQTRGPHEIAVGGGADFVGWEMPGRQMGCMGAEGPSTFGIAHLHVSPGRRVRRGRASPSPSPATIAGRREGRRARRPYDGERAKFLQGPRDYFASYPVLQDEEAGCAPDLLSVPWQRRPVLPPGRRTFFSDRSPGLPSAGLLGGSEPGSPVDDQQLINPRVVIAV